MDFSRQIYDDAKKLFPIGAVETFVSRSSETSAPAVRLVHTSTGIEMICSEFPTQIENYIAAAIRLRIVTDNRGA